MHRSSSAHPPVVRSAPSTASDISFPYGAPALVAPIGAPDRGRPPASVAARSSRDDDDAGQTRKLSSQRLNPTKLANPFATSTKRCKTTFSQSYVAGSIPCRLHSSAVRYTIQWDDHAAAGFSPDLLVVCADGLSETEHPFTLMAPMMFRELVLRAEGCVELFAPVIDQLATHLRKALSADETLPSGLAALHVLMQHTGNLMLPHLLKVLPALVKPFKDKKYRDTTMTILGLMETQCGSEALRMIKSKIPTY